MANTFLQKEHSVCEYALLYSLINSSPLAKRRHGLGMHTLEATHHYLL